VDNAPIADRLDGFASLLELIDVNPYTARAYLRASRVNKSRVRQSCLRHAGI
jgi:hypothetical protein